MLKQGRGRARHWLSATLLSLHKLPLYNRQPAVAFPCSRNIKVRQHDWQLPRAAEMLCNGCHSWLVPARSRIRISTFPLCPAVCWEGSLTSGLMKCSTIKCISIKSSQPHFAGKDVSSNGHLNGMKRCQLLWQSQKRANHCLCWFFEGVQLSVGIKNKWSVSRSSRFIPLLNQWKNGVWAIISSLLPHSS